jgi:hypothetical protein
MCGRARLKKEYPEKSFDGFMDIQLVDKIARQVHPGTIVQFHWNGEPLLYPHLKRAL